jgi:hypothetical protein
VEDDERLREQERQLALLDRVLGLEAELAELSLQRTLSPSAQLAAEQELARLRGSAELRIGHALTAPARVARRTIERRSQR